MFTGVIQPRTWWIGGLSLALLGCQRTESPAEPVEGVASVEVTPAEVELSMGDTTRLVAVARTGNGSPLPGRTILWASERDDLASVDAFGLVTGRGEGTVRITAGVDDKSASAEVRISGNSPQILQVTSIEPQSIQAGWGSFTLRVRGTGFSPFSRVRWNELPLESVRIDETEILATVPSDYVLREGAAEILVESPTRSP